MQNNLSTLRTVQSERALSWKSINPASRDRQRALTNGSAGEAAADQSQAGRGGTCVHQGIGGGGVPGSHLGCAE